MGRRRAVLGVAGSGKTKLAIDSLDQNIRALVITYTRNNLRNIEKRIVDKFGIIPPNVTVLSYFEFLYSYCFRPLFAMVSRVGGIRFNEGRLTPKTGVNSSSWGYYFDDNNMVYHSRLAKLLMLDFDINTPGGSALNVSLALEEIRDRIQRYHDKIIIDEAQDLYSHDFDFMKSVVGGITTDALLLGDFYQHTYSTSQDGVKGKGLYDDYNKYKASLGESGIVVDDETLLTSYRCGPEICSFVDDKLGISMDSACKPGNRVDLVDSEYEAIRIFKDDDVIKLFYRESSKYNCWSSNWGESKGLEYRDVCVITPNTASGVMFGDSSGLKTLIRNGMYVALTRAKGDVYIVRQEHMKKLKLSV